MIVLDTHAEKTDKIGLKHGYSETGFFTKILVVARRLGKKPAG